MTGGRDTSLTRVCEFCGGSFHPWRGSAGRFCSTRCAGRMQSIEARARTQARIVANSTPKRIAEIAAGCDAIYRKVIAS